MCVLCVCRWCCLSRILLLFGDQVLYTSYASSIAIVTRCVMVFLYVLVQPPPCATFCVCISHCDHCMLLIPLVSCCGSLRRELGPAIVSAARTALGSVAQRCDWPRGRRKVKPGSSRTASGASRPSARARRGLGRAGFPRPGGRPGRPRGPRPRPRRARACHPPPSPRREREEGRQSVSVRAICLCHGMTAPKVPRGGQD